MYVSTCAGSESDRFSNARLPAGAGECHPVWEPCFAAERPGGVGPISQSNSQQVPDTDRSVTHKSHKLKDQLLKYSKENHQPNMRGW